VSRLHHASIRETPSHEARAVEGPSPTGDRNRLRVLDACLQRLENAHEHNLLTVSPGLAETLRTQVTGIEVGMTITEAIEVVLREQEPCLRSRRQQRRPAVSDGSGSQVRDAGSGLRLPSSARCDADAPPAPAHGPATGRGFEPRLVRGGDRGLTPLDEPAARSLTERIKRAVGNTCLLLLEAHNRRAWSALGYATWEQYVRVEFGLSRSRSYELLDHGRLIRTIEAAAGVSGVADISTFAARQLKPRLQEVAAEVRTRTANAPHSQVAGIVARVIGDQRAKVTRSGRVWGAEDGVRDEEARRRRPDPELDSLYHCVDTLAHMPAAVEVLARIPLDQRRRLEAVGAAVEWLTSLAGALASSQR
jgi:hypothetical protein